MILLEVCIASVDDAVAARQGGADRVELNCALELGGLTPSPGLVKGVVSHVDIPVVAMVRPRPGGFTYNETEMSVMQADTEAVLEAGADGIAIGMLTDDARIDRQRCRDLIRRARDKPIVFHRAFDELADPIAAIEELADLGVNRILTSGGAPTALQGVNAIRQLIERAAGRVEVLPGSGINAENVIELVASTGCTQVHGSFRRPVEPAVCLASGIPAERSVTDDQAVARVRDLLNGLTDG